MPIFIELEDLTGPHKGQVRRYLKHAGENAIMSGFAKYPEPEEVRVTPIPEDFPGRDKLEEAEIRTIEGIPRDADDLIAFPGIGKGTASKILKALG